MIIRVFEAFAGYGSQMMALRRVARRHAGGADFQLVGWSEIDNDAIAAHNAVFPEYAECNHKFEYTEGEGIAKTIQAGVMRNDDNYIQEK